MSWLRAVRCGVWTSRAPGGGVASEFQFKTGNSGWAAVAYNRRLPRINWNSTRDLSPQNSEERAVAAAAAAAAVGLMRFPRSNPPPPPLSTPPLTDGTLAAIAVAVAFVLLPAAVFLIRSSRRIALQRSLARRALRKRAERDAQRERAAAAGLDWGGLLRWAAPLNPPTPPEEVVELSATALLAAMEARDLSAEYVMRCFVARAMAAGRALQCNAEEPFEAAVAEAAACDAERARGGAVRGVLHGLPISVKDQLDMAGFDSTCGLACRTFAPSQSDALLVALARSQGAIPFVRTSVPQLLMLPETFSAAWGTACNPHDLRRTCGGSTGGEGALTAALNV